MYLWKMPFVQKVLQETFVMTNANPLSINQTKQQLLASMLSSVMSAICYVF